MDRATHRALVEAGYAPLGEYVSLYASRAPAPSERRLDAREGGHDARPFGADASAPFHAPEVAHD